MLAAIALTVVRALPWRFRNRLSCQPLTQASPRRARHVLAWRFGRRQALQETLSRLRLCLMPIVRQILWGLRNRLSRPPPTKTSLETRRVGLGAHRTVPICIKVSSIRHDRVAKKIWIVRTEVGPLAWARYAIGIVAILTIAPAIVVRPPVISAVGPPNVALR